MPGICIFLVMALAFGKCAALLSRPQGKPTPHSYISFLLCMERCRLPGFGKTSPITPIAHAGKLDQPPFVFKLSATRVSHMIPFKTCQMSPGNHYHTCRENKYMSMAPEKSLGHKLAAVTGRNPFYHAHIYVYIFMYIVPTPRFRFHMQ